MKGQRKLQFRDAELQLKGFVALQWAGILLLVLSAGFAIHCRRVAQTQRRAVATVVENIATFAPGGGVRYSPRLRFRTTEGPLIQVETNDSATDAEFAVGQTVPVLYPPDAPQHAVIATSWRAYHRAWVSGIWGVLFFDTGLVLRLLQRRRTMRHPL